MGSQSRSQHALPRDRRGTRPCANASPSVATPAGVDGVEFFESRIRPVLVEHCHECHAGDVAEGGLRLDSRAGFDAGGTSGRLVDDKQPTASLLLRMIRHEIKDREMPQGADKLPDAVIGDFARWIASGLPGLPTAPPTPQEASAEAWAAKLAARRTHWAWQPVATVPIPEVPLPPDSPHRAWLAQPIDRFLLDTILARGLEPGPPADRPTLIRRLKIALVGLPPTPEEIEAFVNDPNLDAYARLVDDLLRSPAFGEHWAEYWLDLMRFGETGGYVRDYPIPEAWRYRDYVIRALNADVPYDQFIAEHLAGDLLPARHNPVLRINEALLGTGSLRVMEVSSTATDVALEEAQMIENQIDTLGKAFQGLTIACARCHDHKFDAISTRDYYGLFGILASSRQTQGIIDDDAVRRSGVARLAGLKQEITSALADQWADDIAHASAALASQLDGGAAANAAGPAGRAHARIAALLGRPQVSPEDMLHPLWKARAAAAGGDVPFAAAFAAAASELRGEAAARARRNATGFRTLADFSESPAGWHTSGVLPDTLHAVSGDVALAASGNAVVERFVPPGLCCDRLSRKHGAVVRSADFPLDTKFISLRGAGGDAAQVRLIQHNFQQMENIAHAAKVRHFDKRFPAWVTVPVGHQATWQGGRSYLEILTKDDVAHFRRSEGDGRFFNIMKSDRTGRSWFAVDRSVAHDGPQPPEDELRLPLLLAEEGLVADSPAKDGAAAPPALAARWARVCTDAIDALRQGRATTLQADLLNWLLASGILRNSTAELGDWIPLLVNEYRQVEEGIPTFRRAAAVAAEGPGFDAAVQRRGQPSQPGETVPRRYLEVLDHDTGRSGDMPARLFLASRITAADNPLTARVFVNRVWSWLFGRGIVATVDNFGATGEAPSHPELLDHLAARFVAEGWSVKQLIREIVATQAYRTTSVPPPGAEAIDPANRLLSHMPLQRLRAETVRDCLLFVSGQLDRSLEGYTGPPDRGNGGGPANRRRGVYQYRKREGQDHMMVMFDAPEAARTVGVREATNVPGQSLLLLNNAFVHAQAKAWAERTIAASQGMSLDRRLSRLFCEALGREPTPEEIDTLMAFLESQAAAYKLEDAALASDPRLWADICHVLFNAKEFLYVR
jgi:hypothetical protein